MDQVFTQLQQPPEPPPLSGLRVPVLLLWGLTSLMCAMLPKGSRAHTVAAIAEARLRLGFEYSAFHGRRLLLQQQVPRRRAASTHSYTAASAPPNELKHAAARDHDEGSGRPWSRRRPDNLDQTGECVGLLHGGHTLFPDLAYRFGALELWLDTCQVRRAAARRAQHLHRMEEFTPDGVPARVREPFHHGA